MLAVASPEVHPNVIKRLMFKLVGDHGPDDSAGAAGSLGQCHDLMIGSEQPFVKGVGGTSVVLQPACYEIRVVRMAEGARTRALRLAVGWSQERLAEAAGVTRQTISRLEGGVNLPEYSTLRAIAAALGVPVTAITEDNLTGGVQSSTDDDETIAPSPEATVALPVFASLADWQTGNKLRTDRILREDVPNAEAVVIEVQRDGPPLWRSLLPGDKLILDTLRRGAQSMEIVVVLLDGQPVLRRFRREGKAHWLEEDHNPHGRVPAHGHDILAVVHRLSRPGRNI